MIREMDWDAHTGGIIRIYRNLNNGTMSIQAKASGWKVVGHVTNAVVGGIKFKVRECARQQVIREKRKNVHAWGEGILLGQFSESAVAPIALGYCPYRDETFVQRDTGIPILTCSHLVVRDNLVFVSPDAIATDTSKPQQPKAKRSSNLLLFSTPAFQFAA